MDVTTQSVNGKEAQGWHILAKVGFGTRGVKKVERTFWLMNFEVASSDEVGFWVEIESRQSGAGQK